MPQRAALAKLALIASIIGGVSYIASWNMGLSDAASLTWKGTGVGLLAVYAALRARDLNGWLLALVMLFGMLGDVLLGVNFILGAVAFLVGHLIAIGLYLRNRRKTIQRSQLALAVVLIPATVIISFLLPADRAGAPGVAFYSLGLAVMAATAWTSRFPRFTVGIGAVMFLVSDLLIFGRMGPLPDTFVVGLGVWGLYYAGQLLICTGAAGAIEHWRESEAKERVMGSRAMGGDIAGVTWLEPWYSVEGPDHADVRAALEHQLSIEVGPKHIFFGQKATLVARCGANDDALFRLENGDWAYVHLTWRRSQEPDPRWPAAARYERLETWIVEVMLPYHAEHGGEGDAASN